MIIYVVLRQNRLFVIKTVNISPKIGYVTHEIANDALENVDDALEIVNDALENGYAAFEIDYDAFEKVNVVLKKRYDALEIGYVALGNVNDTLENGYVSIKISIAKKQFFNLFRNSHLKSSMLHLKTELLQQNHFPVLNKITCP